MKRGTIGWSGAAVLTLLNGQAAAQVNTDTAATNDIVVTALKRPERIQEVPATVSVVTSEDLIRRGITDIRGIANLVPGIQLSAENSATQVFVRGIGQSSDGDSNNPAVAVNFDGVYTPRYAVGTSMFDVAQIEVLPGPQGLLYGRNAAGGAINVNSRLPGSRFAINGIVEGGNFGLFRTSAGVDLPIDDRLSIRAAFDVHRHDGYLSDGQNDADTIAGRLTAAWRPSAALSVIVRGEISHAGGNGAAIVAHPFVDASDPWYNPTAKGDRFYNHETVRKLNAEVRYDTGRVTVTYIPAFIYYDFGYRTPLSVPALAPAAGPVPAAPYGGTFADGTPGGYFAAALVVPRDAQKQYSNELRIASDNQDHKSAGTVSWLVGLYQLLGDTRIPQSTGIELYNPSSYTGGATQPYTVVSWGGANDESHDARSYAAFGQVGLALTDRLRVTGGARYSLDRQRAYGVSQTYLPSTPLAAVAFAHGALVNYNGVVATPAKAYDLRQTDRHADWKVGADWDVGSGSLAYGAIQTGYNQGGFNLGQLTSFKPEHLLAFTLGLKNRFLADRLTLNVEGFIYDYRNLQVSSFDATTGSGFRVNIPRSLIRGTQIDLSYRLDADTVFTGALVLLDARIKRAVLGPAVVYGGTTQYPTCSPLIQAALCADGTQIDYTGYRLDHAPPVSLTANLRHAWHLGGQARLEAAVATHVDAASWGLYSHVPGTRLPAYTNTDASLTYYPPGARWSVAAWVRNIENTARVEALATNSIYGQTPGSIQPPRTFGGRLAVRFD